MEGTEKTETERKTTEPEGEETETKTTEPEGEQTECINCNEIIGTGDTKYKCETNKGVHYICENCALVGDVEYCPYCAPQVMRCGKRNRFE